MALNIVRLAKFLTNLDSHCNLFFLHYSLVQTLSFLRGCSAEGITYREWAPGAKVN